MMKHFFLPLLALGIVVSPIACATALPIPTEENASWAAHEWPGTTLNSLQTGRRCYANTCAACHNLHLPSEFPPEHWEKILERMQPKAHIDDAKKDLILRYLLFASTQATPR